MKKTSPKKALKTYQSAGGNFTTKNLIKLNKEADLGSFYYPGIYAIQDKISKKAANQKKYCRYHRTIGLISTKTSEQYPLLSARAALLSQVGDLNALPLIIRYGELKSLPEVLRKISPSFQLIVCTDFSLKESEIMATAANQTPVLFHDELEAGAVMAAVLNAAKLKKKTIKKLSITLEGSDRYMNKISELLKEAGATTIALIDERGPVYQKRPNMNRDKNLLAKKLKISKDERSREEILKESDVYINSDSEHISSSTTNHLPDKAIIISVRAEEIDKKPKQALVSTLADRPNHITDLHLAAGIAYALAEGKKYGPKTMEQAIQALAKVYKTPKADKLVPGLLEKGLAKKIAKGIK